MPPLPVPLRKILERDIPSARTTAENAARAALTALAADRSEPFTSLSPDQRRLRNALRARARQLSDGKVLEDGLPRLVEEIAYQQWHRMVFARFLAENGLLMHPSGVAVTLQDCAELAMEEGDSDAWSAAARYAAEMLPGIFLKDEPAVQVRFAPEGFQALERLIEGFAPPIFQADDSLGWMYQFWQVQKKQEVNASERKIGGADLPPVTQLFTEDYMVRFLLENSLGAWWAARHPESSLLQEWEYLRWIEPSPPPPSPFQGEGPGVRVPAAGTFPGWPERAAAVTVMDPCCGSGHFLVRAFHMLRRMRMEEEGLNPAAAADAVLRDNLFGLEIDPRCTQIAAFALALEAWKVGDGRRPGFRPLPLPNIACSGIPVQGQLETWLKLAGNDARLHSALERLYYLFKNAPDLGSLINPADVPLNERMFTADYEQAAPLLERALAKEKNTDDPTASVFGTAAEGTARAARLLAGKYTLIATNVPYLGRGKQSEIVKSFCEKFYPLSINDLAFSFLERCITFSAPRSTIAVVVPQSWLFLGTYKKLREKVLKSQTVVTVARLGPGAFETISGHVVNVALSILKIGPPQNNHTIRGIDVSDMTRPDEKAKLLRNKELSSTLQLQQLLNPDARVAFENNQTVKLLLNHVDSYEGIGTGDLERFSRYGWEVSISNLDWVALRGTTEKTASHAGLNKVILWQDGKGALVQLADIFDSRPTRGYRAWEKRGIAINRMGDLLAELYNGEILYLLTGLHTTGNA